MLHIFSVSLEAVDSALGRFSAYRVEASTDLFGAWLVDVTYGRIGTRGTIRRYVAEDEARALKIIRHHLHSRTTVLSNDSAKPRSEVGVCKLPLFY